MSNPDFDRLMKGVIPYLAIDGAETAAAFYVKALGAIQHGPTAHGQDGKVLNIGLEINGGTIMLSDHFPEHGEPPAKGGNGYMMTIVTLDGQMFWDRAIDAGCTQIVPFEMAFWGDKYGQFADPFGVHWAINEPGGAHRDMATGA
jgi:PhnB protein